MLHLETIEPKTLDLLKNLQALPLFAQTRLVGGTALALQLGHRKSIDIDLFGSIEDLPEIIRDECSSLGSFQTSTFSKNFKMFWITSLRIGNNAPANEAAKLPTVCLISDIKSPN